ncbi:MAG: hypothetical protein AAF586_01155 [Planctomycetota bacterium]
MTRSTRHGRMGLTLPELILAMAGTAVVSLAAVTMLFAATQGADDGKVARSLVIEAKAISSRLNASLRGCRQLLDVSSTRVILWSADDDDDGMVDTDELRVFDHTPASDRLSRSTVSVAATPAEYDPLTADFASIVAALDTATQLDTTVWSNRADTFSLSSDAPGDPSSATLLTYRVGLVHGVLSETVAHSVALRNQ